MSADRASRRTPRRLAGARTNSATGPSWPVSCLSSGTQNGFGRNRMSKTKSASSGTPYLKPKDITASRSARPPLVAEELGDLPGELVDVEARGVDDDLRPRTAGPAAADARSGCRRAAGPPPGAGAVGGRSRTGGRGPRRWRRGRAGAGASRASRSRGSWRCAGRRRSAGPGRRRRPRAGRPTPCGADLGARGRPSSTRSCGGQVVDDVPAAVLEDIGGRRPPGPAHPGEDEQLAVIGLGAGRPAAPSAPHPSSASRGRRRGSRRS